MINWMKWEISLKLKRAQRKGRNIYYVCMYVCVVRFIDWEALLGVEKSKIEPKKSFRGALSRYPL